MLDQIQIRGDKMLDFFTIFSKGGIVLWCFQGAGVSESFTGPVNALIRSVILQVRVQTQRAEISLLSLSSFYDSLQSAANAKLGLATASC